MAKFEWEDYVHGYEIDFYNGLTESENKKLKKKLGMSYSTFLGTYFKEGNEWYQRSSGMIFNLKQTEYYPKLKEYLDKEFEKFIRKEKLKEINGK